MYGRSFDSWQDLRDLDQPGSFRKECKSLLDNILQFTCSEAPMYGQVSEEDVEKQDVSYRLLEEENFLLKSEILSLNEIVKLKENEISELKTNISELQCKKQEDETCAELEEISLPDIGHIIKRINSSIEEIFDNNVMEHLRSTSTKNSAVLENEIGESLKGSNLPISSASASLMDQHSSQDLKEVELTKPENTTDNTYHKSGESEIDPFSENSKEEDRLINLKEKYFSIKRENLTLEDRINVLTNKITLLKASLTSCNLELIEYEKMLTTIGKERFSLIGELKQTKHCYNTLRLRNEYLEERVAELQDQLTGESILPVRSNSVVEESEDCRQYEVLNCYKNRLYEAFKEMSVKEIQIEQLNDSINGLVEKFKTEKSSLEVDFADRLKESEDQLKQLCDEKIKLEETIRQQSKLIDHLQALVETKERKSSSKINCLKDS